MSAGPSDPRGPSRGRSRLLLVAAAVVVVAAVAAIVLLGIQRPPPLTRLADAPEPRPDAPIAWTGSAGSDTCLHIARPDGTVDTPWCSQRGGEVVGWDAGRVRVRRWDGDGRELLIDPVTGEATDAGPARDTGAHVPDEAVSTVWDEGHLVVHDRRTDAELWRTPAPEGYAIAGSARSPDGDWIAMTDTADRLLVMPSDGSADPRVWADDVMPWPGLYWRDTT